MSEGQDQQEKTFDPTPARIRKAREEGNVFRSQEIVSVGMLTAGMTLFAVGTPFVFAALKALMTRVFLGAATTPLTILSAPNLFREILLHLGLVLGPFFVLLMVAGFGLNVMQFGWNLTSKPLMPKASRISPMQGFKRIFSGKGLFNVFKSVVKIVIVAPIAYATIKSLMPQLVVLHTLPVEEILQTAAGWFILLLAKLIAVLMVLSGIDFAFEKWRYKEDLKMSFQEVKDESKEQDGNPQLKGKQRELARQILRRPRLDHAVLKADVIVTNPTHYAVALKYDPEVSEAPRVLVKGIRKRALRIKGMAQEHGIPTVENRPLARALYNTVPEDHDIPEELYPAVAALLAEIYRNRDPNR